MHAVISESDATPWPPDRIATAIAAGDRSAEAALAKRYARPLRLFFVQRMNDWTIAEDLAQDVLQVVLRRLRANGLNEPDKLTAYVYRTAQFTESMLRRRRMRHPDYDSGIEPDESIPSTQATPETEAQNAQLTQVVRALMDELSQPRDRELLWAFYVSGASKEDLLDKFKMTPSQFDNALYRARKRLRELLEGWGWPT